MQNQDFTTTIEVDATPAAVFGAINNVRGWWSENIEGDTDKKGSGFSYHYQDVHRANINVTELTPEKKVVWHVVDNYFKFTKDETEWKDTDIIFDITSRDGKTAMTFTHRGLVPDYECFQICHDAWTYYIQGSLKDLIVKGKGNPTPRELSNGESANVLPAAQAGSKAIYHRLLIEVPVEKVYAAITTQDGLSAWWTPETTAKAETGSIARFAFGPDYFKEMKILELRPYSNVKWVCLHGQEEWIGTTISFELEPHRKGSILLFRHEGWKEYSNEFSGCSYAWALFLRSLKLLCETGKGTPYPEVQ